MGVNKSSLGRHGRQGQKKARCFDLTNRPAGRVWLDRKWNPAGSSGHEQNEHARANKKKNARKQEKCKTRHSKAGTNAHERQERSPAAKLQTRRQSSGGEQNKHEKTSPNSLHRGRNRRTSPGGTLYNNGGKTRKKARQRRPETSTTINHERTKQTSRTTVGWKMRSAGCGVWKIRCGAFLDTSHQSGTNRPTPLIESGTRPTKDTNQRPTTKLRADAPLKFKPAKEPGKKT